MEAGRGGAGRTSVDSTRAMLEAAATSSLLGKRICGHPSLRTQAPTGGSGLRGRPVPSKPICPAS